MEKVSVLNILSKSQIQRKCNERDVYNKSYSSHKRGNCLTLHVH